MSSSSFPEVWAEFRQEYEIRNLRLLAEFEAAWKEVSTSPATEPAIWEPVDGWDPSGSPLEALGTLLEQVGHRMLEVPGAILERRQPLARILQAIEDHQTAIEDLARRLPASLAVTGSELLEALDGGRDLRWYLSRWRWRRQPRPFPLRSLMEDSLRRQTRGRSRIDGGWIVLIAQATLETAAPWQIARRQALRALGGQPAEPAAVAALRQRRDRRIAQLDTQALRLRSAWQMWQASASTETLRFLLHRRTPAAPERSAAETARLQNYFAYWSRLKRAVEELQNLERSLLQAGRIIWAETTASVEAADSEHRQLLAELDSVREWLERRDQGEAAGAFPSPAAPLVSAAERLTTWMRAVQAVAREHLPEVIEAVHPKTPLPGRRAPWRRLEPGKQLLQSIERTARPLAREAFQEAETAHRAIVRDVERVRQVVAFGEETAEREGEAGWEVEREARTNARALVEHRQQAAADIRPIVERGLTLGFSAALDQFFVSFEQGRLGVWTLLVREGGRKALSQGASATLEAARRSAVRLQARSQQVWHHLLARIGWVQAPRARLEHVVRRGYLSESLRVDLRARNLPAIYQRLFRLEPVEDPRFLIGREAEMAALAELRQLWESHRAVAAVLVGERGSGKTSLLNGAAARVFPDVELVRGQLQERTLTPADMRQFLRRLLGIAEAADLREALAGRRMVVMLEELERSFLRQINGFEAIRDLLRLIAATSHHILWIVAVNQIAFQFLDAAVHLGRHFSHRLNAMSVEPEDLRNAILLRHNLSGLRLHFSPPPERPRAADVRHRLGIEEDREQSFFDALYRESEGVFRSAFELWQRYIERAEGGVLYMRYPERPRYDALVAGLGSEDFFTLQALLQHGSLTDMELASMFYVAEDESRRRLDVLLARELVQPDPGRQGFRIRPEAGHLVQEALHRRNLL